MQDWTNNDTDWQLKKLQHDSIKTAEKVVEVLRGTIEKEVLAHGKDYERLFGSRSAQFAEYLTMVAQKLEQHGVQHSDVINWLNSSAREGSVPADYASDLRDSQSTTVPFIDGGPMHDWGEQSLLDKSLGTQGVASPRPSGQMISPLSASLGSAQTTTAALPAYESGGSGNGNGNGNGHGHGYAPTTAPGAFLPSIPNQQPQPQPLQQSAPMPMQQSAPMPMHQSVPMPMQPGMPMPMQPGIPMPMQQAPPMPMQQAPPMPVQQAPPMPVQQGMPMPVQQGMPMPNQQGMPMPNQQGVPMPRPQGGPTPTPQPMPNPMNQTLKLPAPQLMPPAQQAALPPHLPNQSAQGQPQPNFNRPTAFAQPPTAPPPPPPPPQPQPNQLGPAPGARRDDRREEEQWDPFTAWD